MVLLILWISSIVASARPIVCLQNWLWDHTHNTLGLAIPTKIQNDICNRRTMWTQEMNSDRLFRVNMMSVPFDCVFFKSPASALYSLFFISRTTKPIPRYKFIVAGTELLLYTAWLQFSTTITRQNSWCKEQEEKANSRFYFVCQLFVYITSVVFWMA